jgi:hypothetical protein
VRARRSSWGIIVDDIAGEWLTYKQAAERIGISAEAIRALARRRGWSRRSPNEIGGAARVLLPPGVDRRLRPGESTGMTAVDQVLTVGRPTVDSPVTLRGASWPWMSPVFANGLSTKTASLPICGIGWMSLTGAWTRQPKTIVGSTSCGLRWRMR